MSRLFPSQTDDKFMLRLPGNLRDRIKGHAKAIRQSMNAAMIVALDAYYPAPVAPESVNEALRKAAEKVVSSWSDALRAMGVDPERNEALMSLRAKIKEADNAAD